MIMHAVLGNASHPEYGVATIPLPIPREQYDHCIELLEALGIGNACERDCKVMELDGPYPVLKRLEMLTVNLDELDYLAKRLDSSSTSENAQFQAMAHKLELFEMKDLINLTFCCQQATVITDFTNLESVGTDHYMNLHGGCASMEELENLDRLETALLLIDSGGGVITPYGVVYDNGMQIEYEVEQLSIFDLDSWCGRMYPEPSPAAHPRAKISGLSSRRSSELKSVAFQSLDLTPGAGNLLGESYWELISPWRGDALTLNTGVSPREESVSSLSQILQEDPPPKYYLTRKACLGILRRAAERGKELPEKLKRALEIQSGIIQPDGKATLLEAYHINQRDEGIDLHGVSGALMATNNMQMQTFVTQPDEGGTEGFDGYNGDLTGDVTATLGVNCGMSTGRTWPLPPISVTRCGIFMMWQAHLAHSRV